MATSTFSKLVDRYRTKGREGKPPIPYGVVAKRAGISRQYLYDLMNGEKEASDAVEVRLARVLSLEQATVHRALTASSLVGR